MTRHNIYETITGRFLAGMKNGVLPWNQGAQATARPRNYKNKHAYRGMNWLSLTARGFGSPYFLTFNQAREMGLTVRKGEKGTPILVYKGNTRTTKSEEAGAAAPEKRRRTFFVSWAYLFNLEQIAGTEKILEDLKAEDAAPVDDAEEIIRGWSGRPDVKTGPEVSYDLDTDTIYLPEQPTFHSAAAFYGAKFQLLIRATGAAHRLNRPSLMDYAGQRAFEELVSEIGRSFLGQIAGIATEEYLDDALASIKSWVSSMEDDPKYIILAAHYASQAVEYMLGEKVERYEEVDVDEI
jgi:antirestriction protein ArdC